MDSGSHLLSRAVSSQVSSADCVLTFVFGMGTGVPHNRIATGNLITVFPDIFLSIPYILYCTLKTEQRDNQVLKSFLFSLVKPSAY